MDKVANVSALGVRWKGAGVNDPVVTLFTLGLGVCGGIMSNGELCHGVSGSGGVLGHVTVYPVNGYLVTCGKRGVL